MAGWVGSGLMVIVGGWGLAYIPRGWEGGGVRRGEGQWSELQVEIWGYGVGKGWF